jgi:hypothetical protein
MLPLFFLAIAPDSASIEVELPPAHALRSHRMAEIVVRAEPGERDPWDPDLWDLDVTLRNGGREQKPLPFWDGDRFRIRFVPDRAGAWSASVRLRADGKVAAAERASFRIPPGGSTRFVRRSERNPRYFSVGAKTFFPVGLNLCWPDASGLASYDRRFKKLAAVGGNFSRVWTRQERLHEVRPGVFNPESGAFYDEVFRLAEKHGIYLMLTIDDYRILAKSDFFVAHWDKSPYNRANGGPIAEPLEFFTNAEVKRMYKRKLRYLVARYGAFSSLAMWELWNEQDHIPKPGVPIEWFREMTQSLADLDAYDHLITTSYSWDDRAEVWQSPALDVTQRHLYGQGDTVDFVSEIARNAEKLDRFGKPRLIGEFGITWKEADIALDKGKLGTPLHDALWASTLSGDAGTAMTWWWDNYLEPLNLWHVFEGISRFVASVDFANRNFRPTSVVVPGFDSLALRDSASGEMLLWIHDPQSNWKNDAEGRTPQVHEEVWVNLPPETKGRAEVWDTRTGRFVTRALTTSADSVRLKLPAFARDVAVKVKPPKTN